MTDKSRRFYFNRPEDYEPALLKKRFSDRKLEVKVVEKGIILPTHQKGFRFEGGVCDRNINFVAGYSRTRDNRAHWGSVASAYSVDKKEISYLDEDVIFGGALMGHLVIL